MPRAAKNSLGVMCPPSTGVLGKEGEVGTLAGLEKGVGYLKGEMRGHVILQRLMCLREKGIRPG